MENGSYGVIVAYADDISDMRALAKAVIHRRAEFRAIGRTRIAKRVAKNAMSDPLVDENGQLRLPLDETHIHEQTLAIRYLRNLPANDFLDLRQFFEQGFNPFIDLPF